MSAVRLLVVGLDGDETLMSHVLMFCIIKWNEKYQREHLADEGVDIGGISTLAGGVRMWFRSFAHLPPPSIDTYTRSCPHWFFISSEKPVRIKPGRKKPKLS